MIVLVHEVLTVFKSFHVIVQTQFLAKIHNLIFDNGGEYIKRGLYDYFQHHGILHETSSLRTPQQNGIDERKN